MWAPAAADAVIAARESGGPFKSLYDLCERVDLASVNKRILENFIKAGALASLGGNRAQLTAVIENAMESGQRAWKDRESGQAGLFGMATGEPDATWSTRCRHCRIGPCSRSCRARKKCSASSSPAIRLDEYQDKVAELSTHDTETLEGLERGAEVAICGILTGIVRKRNKDGKLWAAMRVEDRKGGVEAMAFSTQYDRLLTGLVEDQAVLVRGLVLPEENGPPKISIQDIIPLQVARVNLPTLISIRVGVGVNGTRGNVDKAEALNQLFARKRGETEVRLRLEKPRDFSVILDVAPKVRPDKEFWAEVERICGPESLEILAS